MKERNKRNKKYIKTVKVGGKEEIIPEIIKYVLYKMYLRIRDYDAVSRGSYGIALLP